MAPFSYIHSRDRVVFPGAISKGQTKFPWARLIYELHGLKIINAVSRDLEKEMWETTIRMRRFWYWLQWGSLQTVFRKVAFPRLRMLKSYVFSLPFPRTRSGFRIFSMCCIFFRPHTHQVFCLFIQKLLLEALVFSTLAELCGRTTLHVAKRCLKPQRCKRLA